MCAHCSAPLYVTLIHVVCLAKGQPQIALADRQACMQNGTSGISACVMANHTVRMLLLLPAPLTLHLTKRIMSSADWLG
jgi:hypothetical protein